MKRLTTLLLLLFMSLALLSCEPDENTCWTEVMYYYPDGTIEFVDIYYDCETGLILPLY